jgi:putative transcriptional regulator
MDDSKGPMERIGGNPENRRDSPAVPRGWIRTPTGWNPPPIDYEEERKKELEELVAVAQYGPLPGFVPQPVNVRLLRRRLRMTRAEFARRFGFPVETVRHWERGDRKPRRAALVALNLIDRNSMVALRLLRNRSG